ncbi:MAG TPA: hypothetical protein VMD56_10015 [Steroidobacteraceae bacterium]|nr:hypothetical protein [Steroidobacteraceae bacterium]
MMQHLSDWLAATWLSQRFARSNWFVPAVQSVHILAIALVLALLFTLHLRLLGVTRGGPPPPRLAAGYLPWVWRGLGVLLITGVLLTITEPARELLDICFRVKMLLVLTLVALTGVLQAGWRRSPDYWNASRRRRHLGGAIAIGSLLLCVCIVVAGRLIAYV